MNRARPLQLLCAGPADAPAWAQVNRILAAQEVAVSGPEAPDQRLREIVSGSLEPDLALILTGEQPDLATRRLAYVLFLLGVPVAFAIAAPDLDGIDPEAFAAAAGELNAFAARLGGEPVPCFPVTAGAAPSDRSLADYLARLGTRSARPAQAHTAAPADHIRATIIWTGTGPLLRGRSYLVRTGAEELTATVAPIKHRLDLERLEPVPATRLKPNEIGDGEIELSAPIPTDPYRGPGGPGGLILADRLTGEAVGIALVRFGLRRAANLSWQAVSVDRAARAAGLEQTPCVLWLTGLSGAGKSAIADRVESLLHQRGRHTYLLDGDNVRHGLNRDLGFTDADRVENIRRVAEVARLMLDAGLIVLVSFISPFRSEREMARGLFAPGEFFEVFVDTPLEVAEARDSKGLYGKARRGELANFTGIDSPYEPPEHPELRLATTGLTVQEAADAVLALLAER